MIGKRIGALGGLALAVTLVLLVIPASQAFAGGEGDSCQLSPAVQRAIQKEFPTWNVVTIDNLNPDDRALWLQEHSNECPGFAVGNFDGRGSPSYAVTLLRHQGEKLWQMLLVVRSENEGYRLHVLSKAQETAHVSVVEKLPPGNYSSIDQSARIRARFPVIQYEAIEAGAIIYYWRNGRYNSLATSE
jgi:hypothetical protein